MVPIGDGPALGDICLVAFFGVVLGAMQLIGLTQLEVARRPLRVIDDLEPARDAAEIDQTFFWLRNQYDGLILGPILSTLLNAANEVAVPGELRRELYI